jgi:hypothetical protein
MAAFLGMDRQHFTNSACFAKWVEQILCVTAVVRPKSRGRRNHAVGRKLHRTFACRVILNSLNLVLQIARQFKNVRHEGN